ncbi:MAG: site-specific integrase [Bacteroidota bacterium]|nr:site-specific integrase [Bacteroidota bacterium]
MILPIKPICKKEWVRRDGTSIIFLQYCRSSDERVLVDTGLAIPPEYWNRKYNRISSGIPNVYGETKFLEDQLSKKIRRAEDLVKYAISQKNISATKFLKEKFSTSFDPVKSTPALNIQQNMDVFFHIDEYIKAKEGKVKRCTINVIGAMKNHLKSFQAYRKKPISFESFDVTFYEQFLDYLVYEIPHARRTEVIKGLKINSIGKTVKHLKSFLKDRMKKKIIPFVDLSDYKVLEEDVDAVYLSWEEISAIYHLDLSQQQHLEKYRDLLVIGCLTGFRFSDYSDIKPEEIRGGMLYVNQTKTLSTVVVPLRSDVKAILIDKYHMRMPQVSNPNFNEYIKDVCKLAGITEQIKITHKRGNKIIEEIRPKYAWITSHTCRRSFCTNEYLAGTPTDLIMTISGHKTEKAFRRYIKADKVQKAFLIKKIWDSRPGL